jgi:hypothetical protein
MKYKKIDINYEINKIDTRNKLKLKNFHYKKQYLIDKGYTVISNKAKKVTNNYTEIYNKQVEKIFSALKMFV